MEQIAGIIKSIRYKNDKNGYTVCDLKTEKSVITMVGIMPYVTVGENVVAKGAFVDHADYGRQFRVEDLERKTPTNEHEIAEYLSSGFIKGLGPATARTIVDTFGEKTFDILMTEPLRLSELKGISPERALFFGQAFVEHENIRSVAMMLQKYNVSPGYADKIIKRLGKDAEEIIRRNPYIMVDKSIGLDFSVCDKLASSFGVEPYDKERLKAALKSILYDSINEGNTYIPKEELTEKAIRLTGAEPELILDAFDALHLEGRIFIEKKFPDRVYTDTLAEAERYCAWKLESLNNSQVTSPFDGFDELLRQYEEENDIYLDDIQKEAVKCALTNGICIVTGGPGTGKTTIIKALIYLFGCKGLSVILAAPTGRAAKRVSETSGCEAKTIHRLLEVGYNYEDDENPYFFRDEDNPLSADVIIVDEASMIDIVMMSALLRAFPPGARLILVGDADQLPSVGPGKVLSDMIESGRFPVIKLKTLFRQMEESLIATNAHLINEGVVPSVNNEEGDFYFIQKLSGKETTNCVVDLCTRIIPERFGFDPLRDIQVLSPMRKGETGINRLNELLQRKLNPESEDKPQKIWGSSVFRQGDRVMQIKNDYTMPWVVTETNGGWTEGLGVYNGDMGIIIDIDEKAEIVTVRFDDNRTCEYRFEQLDNLEHAYAITVHKSQGTEFPVVVIPLYGVPGALACRNLLYTAVTRAKKLVVLVGSPSLLEKMILNTNGKERYSGLKERFGGTFN